MLIGECTLAGERRADDVVPAHPNGIQVSRDRWLLVYATRGFRGVDDDRSIVYQVRRGAPDGPVLKEGMLACADADWDPFGDGKKLCFKQHGHPVVFGVPKGARIDGKPAPSAGVFAAKRRIVGRLLDKQRDYLERASADPDLQTFTQGVQWVQFRLNAAEDDIEILQPVAALCQKGYEGGPAFFAADVGWMNQTFTPPVPFNRQGTAWADCNHFDKGIAVLRYTFNPKRGLYEWTALGPVLADRKWDPGEASLARFGDEWVIAARVSSSGVGWVRTGTPLPPCPRALYAKDPPAGGCARPSSARTACCDCSAATPPPRPARTPATPSTAGTSIRPTTSRLPTACAIFDSVQAGLPIRPASQPKVDMCKLLPPLGRTQTVVYRVIPRSLGRPYEGYSGKPSGIPIINKEEKECAGIYYSQITYREVAPPLWEFGEGK